MNVMKTIAVSLSREFDAPSEAVFDAWLDPRMIRRWFAPGLGEMTRTQIDPVPGGSFFLDQRRGDEIARHWGRYLEIDRPRRLVFTWCVDGADGEDRVSIDISPTPRGCRLTLTHEMDAAFADYADRTEAGWRQMVDTLAQIVAHECGYGRRLKAGTVRFERLLPGPIERVWAYLTDSDKRGQWLAAGAMEPRVGSTLKLHFDHASLSPDKAQAPERYRSLEGGCTTSHRITHFEPPHLLGLTWGGGAEGPSEVTFELAEEGEQVRLVLTHRRLAGAVAMADVASGWHAHLAMLSAKLRAEAVPAFWPLLEAMENDYTHRLASGE